MMARRKSFCTLLKDMVKDEYSAHNKDYPKLKRVFEVEAARLADPEAEEYFKEQLDDITSDEGRHHEILDSFFKTYCKMGKK